MLSEQVDKKNYSILALNLDEKIDAYQRIWQSKLDDIQTETYLLSEDQITEIDKRLDRIEKGESKLYTRDEIKQELKAGL